MFWKSFVRNVLALTFLVESLLRIENITINDDNDEKGFIGLRYASKDCKIMEQVVEFLTFSFYAICIFLNQYNEYRLDSLTK